MPVHAAAAIGPLPASNARSARYVSLHATLGRGDRPPGNPEAASVPRERPHELVAAARGLDRRPRCPDVDLDEIRGIGEQAVLGETVRGVELRPLVVSTGGTIQASGRPGVTTGLASTAPGSFRTQSRPRNEVGSAVAVSHHTHRSLSSRLLTADTRLSAAGERRVIGEFTVSMFAAPSRSHNRRFAVTHTHLGVCRSSRP